MNNNKRHNHASEAAAAASAMSNAFDGKVSHFTGAATVGSDNKTFTHVVRNRTDKPLSIAICTGYLPAALVRNQQGVAVDAILKEGTVLEVDGKSLTCQGDPKSFDEFIAFAKCNPLKMSSLKLRVDDAAQLEQNIHIQKMSPFGNLGDSRIVPSVYKNPSQNNDKLVEVPLTDVQIDNQTVITCTIGAGREVSFTWFLESMYNQAEELRKWAAKAKK